MTARFLNFLFVAYTGKKVALEGDRKGMLDFKYWQALFKSDVDAIFKILLGSILLLVPGLNLAVLGYGQRCLFNSLRQRKRLPAWHNCKELLLEGAIALGIAAAYLALPLIIGFILRPLFGLGKLFGWFLAGVSALFIPLGWANWQACNEWKAAFTVSEIWSHLCAGCASYLLLMAGMVAVIAIGIVLLFTIPVLGIAGAVLIFTASVIFFFQVGLIFRCP